MPPQDKLYVENTKDKNLVERVRRSNRLVALRSELGPELVGTIEQIYREGSAATLSYAYYGAVLGSGLGALVGLSIEEFQHQRKMTRRDFGNYITMTLMGVGGGFIFGGIIGDGVGEGQAQETLHQRISALMEQHQDKKTVLQEYLHLAYPRFHFSAP